MYHLDPKLSEITEGTMRDLKIDDDGAGLPVPGGAVPDTTANFLRPRYTCQDQCLNTQRGKDHRSRQKNEVHLVPLRSHLFS